MTEREFVYPIDGNAPSGAKSLELADFHGPTPPVAGQWWSTYTRALEAMATSTAAQVVSFESNRLAAMALPEASATLAWSEKRVRTGIVVGSVQSGKTAYMMGLAARLLDAKCEILVVLAGTRVSLWLQTYERFLDDLDASTMDTAYQNGSKRVLVPTPHNVLASERVRPRDYLGAQIAKFERAVRSSVPVIFIVPKEDDHLIALRGFLEKHLSSAHLVARGSALRLLVLDDEADDASVLDARADRTTPRLIEQLWAGSGKTGATRHPLLFASYVAFTATPQANFLQANHNPLSPRDFEAALRLPGEHGDPQGSDLTYAEPNGIEAYYTGGHHYYERFRDTQESACIPYSLAAPTVDESAEDGSRRLARLRSDMIGDALRAYFVAGALRLASSGRRLSALAALVKAGPVSRADVDSVRPPAHSMLFHPSASMDQHFDGARDISDWSAERDIAAVATGGPPRNNELDVEGLKRRLASEDSEWRKWYERYDATARVLNTLPGGGYQRPSSVPWAVVRELLVNEVFPHTRIRVVNSSPDADDRPRFEPLPDGTLGGFNAPQDLFSIFVAGNVLSRGLTLNGLCTSLFLRQSGEPAADTQMQMQRWFGYRGAHLPFCKVFLHEDQLALFRSYHAADEALKRSILRRSSSNLPGHRTLVLQGEAHVATAKVPTSRAPLFPGYAPGVRLVEWRSPSVADANIDVVGKILRERDFVSVEATDGETRGVVSAVPFTMDRVADLLSDLRYTTHQPLRSDPIYARWDAIQVQVQSTGPLLRLPDDPDGSCEVGPTACPYTIAAYLRLWSRLLTTRDTRGFYCMDPSSTPWHLADLKHQHRREPPFYVGVRFGREGFSDDPRLAVNGSGLGLMKREMEEGPSSVLKTLWGTRGDSATYFGDPWMDYHYHQTSPLPARGGSWRRPVGHPGLCLIHLVRHSSGKTLVAIGLSLPHGGPDHVAALAREPS